MIIYMAGMESIWQTVTRVKPHAILCSFYHIRKMKRFDLREVWEALDKPKIFLDSGGFTLIYRKEKPDREYLRDYVKFVKKYEDILEVYANIDTDNPEETWKNQRWLEKHGINPAPVWHVGESNEWLRRYVEGYDYILVGGFGIANIGEARIDSEEMNQRARQVAFKIKKMGEECGKNDVKIHLFGLTRKFAMFSKIVYSMDSSSWIGGRHGGISILTKDGIEISHWKDVRARLKSYAKRYGIPQDVLNGVKSGNSNAINEWNAYVWKKLQEIWHPEFAGTTETGEKKMLVVTKDGRIMDVSRIRMNGVKTGAYSRALRGLICDNCPIAEKCPKFEQGGVCFYEKVWRKWGGLRDKNAVLKAIEEELADMKYRLERAKSFEDVEGGFLEKAVSNLQERYVKLLMEYYRIRYPQAMIEVKQNIQQNNLNIENFMQLIQQLPEEYNKVMEKWAEWKTKKIDLLKK